MKKFFALLIVCMMAVSACAMAEIPQMSMEEYPSVDGSTAMLPLSQLLYRAVTGADEVQAQVNIVHHRTTNSFYKLADGEADILIVGKPAQEALDYAENQGVELLMQPISVDAMVFLVSDLNPVENVTSEEIEGIYTGVITNWSQLGGEDLAIIPYQRNSEAGSQVMMENVVMQGRPMMEAPVEMRPGDMGSLVDVVASYRNTADAIGYSVYYYVTQMYVQQGIKLLSVNGIAPNEETISTGVYPYTQYGYAVIRADAPADSPERILFDFLTSDEGRQFILDNGYVPAMLGEDQMVDVTAVEPQP